MKDSIIGSIERFRWPILLIGTLFALFCYSEKSKLGFTDDYRMFFSKDNVNVLAYDHIQKTYDKTDNVLIVIEPEGGTIFNDATLASIHSLTEQAWQLPFSIRVESLTNFQHSYADSDGMAVEELYSGGQLTSQEMANLRNTALSEPLVVGRLVDEQGKVAAINVVFGLPGKAINESAIVSGAIRELIASLDNVPGFKATYMSGSIMLNTAFGDESQKDATSLTPIMYGVIIAFVGLLLRSVIGVAAAVILIWVCTVITTGMMASLGILMTPPSSIAPTIILTIAVADAVHILSGFLKRWRSGLSKDEALSQGLQANFFAITLTSITTAIGFLNLNFSEAPPYQDLGNVVAIGVIAAYLYSVFWLPALLRVLPLEKIAFIDKLFTNIRTKAESGSAQILSDTTPAAIVANLNPIQKFVQGVVNAPKLTLLLLGAFAIVSILCIPMNRINDAYVEYFSTDTKFRQDTDFIAQNLTGVYSIELDIKSSRDVSISDPQFLRELDTFVEWARKQEIVAHVASITDIMKKISMNLHEDDPAYYRLSDDGEFSSQALFLYEMSLPYGLDLNNQVSQDKKSTRVVITLENMGTEDIILLERSIAAWIEKNTPDLISHAGSPTLMFSYISEQNVNSMLIGTFMSLALISLLIGITFRSWKFTSIAVVTNFLPITVAFGVWGLLVGEIGLSVSIVSGISLGIVVDDTIHLLANYNDGRKEQGLSSHDAILYAFGRAGGALLITSMVLIAGFGIMYLSDFLLNSAMGLLTAVTLFLAIVFDFTILPALLTIYDGDKADETVNDVNESADMHTNS
jgi:predicted RND superfamily exporter protein